MGIERLGSPGPRLGPALGSTCGDARVSRATRRSGRVCEKAVRPPGRRDPPLLICPMSAAGSPRPCVNPLRSWVYRRSLLAVVIARQPAHTRQCFSGRSERRSYQGVQEGPMGSSPGTRQSLVVQGQPCDLAAVALHVRLADTTRQGAPLGNGRRPPYRRSPGFPLYRRKEVLEFVTET